MWLVALVCMGSFSSDVNLMQSECEYADPVLFMRHETHDTKENCYKSGKLTAMKLKLPAGKWLVLCFEAEAVR